MPIDVSAGSSSTPVRRNLGSGQLTMWQVHHLLPEAPAANRTEELWLRGELDVEALERALAAFVQRHPQLRTAFGTDDGLPVALEYESVPFELPGLKHHCDDPENDADLRKILRAEAGKPFDLKAPPLLRALLVEVAKSHFVLVLTSHHIVTDATSGVVLLGDELAGLYNAKRGGGTEDLPMPTKTFEDFIEWQRSRNDEKWKPRWLKFADKVLNGAPAYLDLPTDLPRPPRPTGRGGLEQRRLRPELQGQVNALADELGARPFDVLLAAFYALMHRYSKAEDIVLGTPHASRSKEGFDQIYGCLMNPLVVRCDLSGAPTFAELVKRVQSSTMKAFAYSDLTVEGLFEHRVGVRDPSRSPIYQVMFNYLNFPAFEASWDGIEVKERRGDPGGAMLDITFDVAEETDGLVATTNYNTDVFLPASARRMLAHYDHILAAAVADAQAEVGALAFLDTAEVEQLASWNATETDYPTDLTLHAMMREQIAKTPERIAVADGEREWTYQELEDRSNQLAHCLREHGVGPEVGVCLLLDRSLEMVLGLHGTIRSGGGWVPLGPDNAKSRLGYMISEMESPVVLTQSHLKDRLPEIDAKIICLDGDWDEIAKYPTTPPEDGATPSSLAYVIYTSGSTGNPKGVMNEHGGICNRLFWTQEAFGLVPDDRVLQKTPYTFDVSVWEFYWPLMVGATIEVAAPGEHMDPRALAARIVDRGVTTMHFVPSMLDAFVDSKGSRDCDSLRRVICSGEALPGDLVARFYSRLPGTELHNLYGPTEAAVDVTHWACPKDREVSVVPIGKPIANCQIHILDDRLQQLPVGVPGELHIGGIQVARGYHRMEELTASKFIADPFFPDDPKARLYKTGDLARWNDAGDIEFMGRLDFQVKLRGFRIELGDIESNLLSSDDVRQAAVILREDRPGDKKLVAYVVAEEGRTPDEAALRDQLGAAMPSYMVPSRILTIDAFPTNISGKLDRKRLPAPPQGAVEETAASDPPRPGLETDLCAIWIELLGISEIGRDDDFFGIGGNSITAVRMVGKVEQKLGIELSLGTVFAAPTLAKLAAHMGAGGEAANSSVISLQAGTAELPLFCICGIHLYAKLAAAIGPHQSVYGVYLKEEGDLMRAAMNDPDSIELDVCDLASKYVDAVVEKQPEGPYCLAGVSFGGVLAFEMARQLRARGKEVAMIVLLDAILPSGMKLDVGLWAQRQVELVEGDAVGWFKHKAQRALSLASNKLPISVPTRKKAEGDGVDLAGAGAVAAFTRRAYAEAAVRWEATPKPYDGPVHFAAAADHSERVGRRIEPMYGWEQHVSSDFTICVVPGTHVGILDDPGVKPLGAHVGRWLDAARERHRRS